MVRITWSLGVVNKTAGLEQRLHGIGHVLGLELVGGDDMISRGSVFRGSFAEHLFDFLGKRLGPGQRRSLRVSADPSNYRGDLGRQPYEDSGRLQGMDVAGPENHPAARVDDLMILRRHVTTDLGFEIAKRLPPLSLDDLWNGAAGPLHDLCVRGDESAVELGRQNLPDMALAGASVADQNDVHRKK